MAEERLHILARLRAKPDRIEDLRFLLEGLVAPTRAEPGCIRYELWRNREDPAEFTFVEEWAGDEALQAHFETQHVEDALDRFPELLETELDLRRYSLIR